MLTCLLQEVSKSLQIVTMTEKSPETQQTPEKEVVFVPLFLCGHNYPSLRGATHVTFCSVHQPQPMYVPQKSQKVSMYSNWRVVADSASINDPPWRMMAMYNSQNNRKRYLGVLYTVAHTTLDHKGVHTHSSYWECKKQNEEKGLELVSQPVTEKTEQVVNGSEARENLWLPIQQQNISNETTKFLTSFSEHSSLLSLGPKAGRLMQLPVQQSKGLMYRPAESLKVLLPSPVEPSKVFLQSPTDSSKVLLLSPAPPTSAVHQFHTDSRGQSSKTNHTVETDQTGLSLFSPALSLKVPTPTESPGIPQRLLQSCESQKVLLQLPAEPQTVLAHTAAETVTLFPASERQKVLSATAESHRLLLPKVSEPTKLFVSTDGQRLNLPFQSLAEMYKQSAQSPKLILQSPTDLGKLPLQSPTESGSSSSLQMQSPTDCTSSANSAKQRGRVAIISGGYKSDEDYTYVRGRGRGRYVCEECGIRCRKPSMLRKHIRTHTDIRPYSCKHCDFKFKTKGNLTKHMKSKAHTKKCLELNIIPVPITVDDSQIDEEALARQEEEAEHLSGYSDNDNEEADEASDDFDEDGQMQVTASGTSTVSPRNVQNGSLMTATVPVLFSSSVDQHGQYTLQKIPGTVIVPSAGCVSVIPSSANMMEVGNRTVMQQYKDEKSYTEKVHCDSLRQVSGDTGLLTVSSAGYVPEGYERMYTRLATRLEYQGARDQADTSHCTFIGENSMNVASKHNYIHVPTRSPSVDRSISESNSGSTNNVREEQILGRLQSLYEHEHEQSHSAERLFKRQRSVSENTAELGRRVYKYYNNNNYKCQRLGSEKDAEVLFNSPAVGQSTDAAQVSISPSRSSLSVSESVPNNAQMLSEIILSPKTMSSDADMIEGDGLSSGAEAEIGRPHQRKTCRLDSVIGVIKSRHFNMALSSPGSSRGSEILDKHTQQPERFSKSEVIPDDASHQERPLGNTQAVSVCSVISSTINSFLPPRKRSISVNIPCGLLTERDVSFGSGTLKKLLEMKHKSLQDPSTQECSVVYSHVEAQPDGNGESVSESKGKRTGYEDLLPKHKWKHIQQGISPSSSTQLTNESVEGDKLSMSSTKPVQDWDRSVHSLQGQYSQSIVSGQIHIDQQCGNEVSCQESGKQSSNNDNQGIARSAEDEEMHKTKYKSLLENEIVPIPGKVHEEENEGRCVCDICQKVFSKPSSLRLHVNIHYFERPYRCDNCAVSFRTKGHLQKHQRSESHLNKLSRNVVYGAPSSDNPRPFKCTDCQVAFRIHGHLAKHLRSKLHIGTLERMGKVASGAFEEDPDDGEYEHGLQHLTLDRSSGDSDTDTEGQPIDYSFRLPPRLRNDSECSYISDDLQHDVADTSSMVVTGPERPDIPSTANHSVLQSTVIEQIPDNPSIRNSRDAGTSGRRLSDSLSCLGVKNVDHTRPPARNACDTRTSINILVDNDTSVNTSTDGCRSVDSGKTSQVFAGSEISSDTFTGLNTTSDANSSEAQRLAEVPSDIQTTVTTVSFDGLSASTRTQVSLSPSADSQLASKSADSPRRLGSDRRLHHTPRTRKEHLLDSLGDIRTNPLVSAKKRFLMRDLHRADVPMVCRAAEPQTSIGKTSYAA